MRPELSPVQLQLSPASDVALSVDVLSVLSARDSEPPALDTGSVSSTSSSAATGTSTFKPATLPGIPSRPSKRRGKRHAAGSTGSSRKRAARKFAISNDDKQQKAKKEKRRHDQEMTVLEQIRKLLARGEFSMGSEAILKLNTFDTLSMAIHHIADLHWVLNHAADLTSSNDVSLMEMLLRDEYDVSVDESQDDHVSKFIPHPKPSVLHQPKRQSVSSGVLSQQHTATPLQANVSNSKPGDTSPAKCQASSPARTSHGVSTPSIGSFLGGVTSSSPLSRSGSSPMTSLWTPDLRRAGPVTSSTTNASREIPSVDQKSIMSTGGTTPQLHVHVSASAMSGGQARHPFHSAMLSPPPFSPATPFQYSFQQQEQQHPHAAPLHCMQPGFSANLPVPLAQTPLPTPLQPPPPHNHINMLLTSQSQNLRDMSISQRLIAAAGSGHSLRDVTVGIPSQQHVLGQGQRAHYSGAQHLSAQRPALAFPGALSEGSAEEQQNLLKVLHEVYTGQL